MNSHDMWLEEVIIIQLAPSQAPNMHWWAKRHHSLQIQNTIVLLPLPDLFFVLAIMVFLDKYCYEAGLYSKKKTQTLLTMEKPNCNLSRINLAKYYQLRWDARTPYWKDTKKPDCIRYNKIMLSVFAESVSKLIKLSNVIHTQERPNSHYLSRRSNI